MNIEIFTKKLSIAAKNNLNIELTEKQQEHMFLLVERLVEVNKFMNLTAITDEDGIILRHLVDSLLISEYIPQNAKLIDVGCGAGFPSLPLAIVREDISITALDSTEKRIRYVAETAKLLGLDNVRAIAARAEDFAKLPEEREKYDCATARAVAALPILCELTIPFVRVGGKFVAMKAKGAVNELEESRSAMRQLAGAKSLENTVLIEKSLVGSIGGTEVEEKRTLVLMNKILATPKAFPRKFAQIKKTPL